MPTEFQKAPILARIMVRTFQGMGERDSELGHFEQQYFCWKETVILCAMHTHRRTRFRCF
jgi:hypothetical protein